MNGHTILIADNDNDYRKIVSEFLRGNGFFVIEASNPEETEKLLNNPIFDIAILDIRMEDDEQPFDDSGLKLIIRSAPHIPKIILTAYPNGEMVKAGILRIGGRLPDNTDIIDKADNMEVILSVLKKIISRKNIFIVFCEEGKKECLELTQYLKQLELNPILLKDLAIGGSSYFDKLKKGTDCKFAIALFTPDEHCKILSYGGKEEKRVHQDVILEMGYCVGKLSRSLVCFLYKDEVDLPTNIEKSSGINMDPEGGWKFAVARELRAADFDIDFNKIL